MFDIELTVSRAKGFPRFELIEYKCIQEGDPSECFNGGVNAYFKVVDADGQMLNGDTLMWCTPDEQVPFVLGAQPAGYCYDERGHEIMYGVACPMDAGSSFSPDRDEVGPLFAYVKGNSDVLYGMGLPLRHHVQYIGVWEYKASGTDPDPDEPPPPADDFVVGGLYRLRKANARKIVFVRELEL